jgi:serine/threonine-protein kinase
VELDPVSAAVNFALAHDLWMARRYDEAIVQSRRVLELHPETRHAYNVIGHCYAKKGMYREAEAAFHEFKPNTPPSTSPWISYVLALEGKKTEAEAIIIEARNSEFLDASAHCYAAPGENDRALDSLEKAFSEHNPNLVWAKTRPEYDSLRGEPRFIAMLQKMGFTP